MSKLFKTAMLLFTAILSAATGNAAEFYVDPVLGDDAFDGSQPKPAGGESKAGPKKTLVGVMQLVTANNGDIVYAAPGEYKSLDADNYRVKIPARTSLIASGKVEETFIIGANATGVAVDEEPWGCGTDAIRCAHMAANSRLVGFTVCGGRGAGIGDNYGGGIIAVNSNNVVVADCVISNNVSGRAGGMSNGIAVRCEFSNNRAKKSGPHVMKSSLYNCYLHSLCQIEHSFVFNNRMPEPNCCSIEVYRTCVYDKIYSRIFAINGLSFSRNGCSVSHTANLCELRYRDIFSIFYSQRNGFRRYTR